MMEETIVKFMKRHNFMWNKGHKDYGNMGLRNLKFKELSYTLKIPPRRLKEIWRTMKDSYVRELKVRKTRSDSGKPPKMWKWMEQMSFLGYLPTENIKANSSRKDEEMAKTSDASIFEPSKTEINPIEPYRIATYTSEHVLQALPSVSCSGKSHNENSETAAEAEHEVTSTTATETRITLSILELVDLLKCNYKEKSACRLFFENLAQQTEDAELTALQTAHLQSELLAAFNRRVYNI